MGCDIHTFIEVGYQYTHHPAGKISYHSFGGQIHLPRDYAMFGIMAGVRVPDLQYIPLRGLPNDLGWAADTAAWLRVVDDADGAHQHDDRTTILRRHAAGLREWRRNGETDYVLDPDAHSHTWLRTNELAECIGAYMIKVGRAYSVEYDAVLAAMRTFEDAGLQARLVVWFDN